MLLRAWRTDGSEPGACRRRPEPAPRSGPGSESGRTEKCGELVEDVEGTRAVADRVSERAPSRAGHENFPVALRVLPAAVRRHLLAIYGFARLVDDLGDEAPGDRGALLDWLDHELDLAFTGTPTNPVMQRLAASIRECPLPEEPFRRLVEANRRDQRVDRYRTWADLREYCSYSADPVGRLVLAVFGAGTPERIAWSDDVCTGLQLVEHLQDVAEDLARGRVYLPLEDLERFGCDQRELSAAHAGAALGAVVRFEVVRARELLRSGVTLAASLRGRARLAISGFTGGGLAALDAIERAGYDVLGVTCSVRRFGALRRMAGVVASASRRP